MTNFRQQIKILMRQKDYSAAKLARRADLNSSTVYNFLQGKTEMTAFNLSKLFDTLNAAEDAQ